MKEYKTNNELIEYLKNKNVIIDNEDEALEKIERYTYYSIINGYKEVFKDNQNNYKNNVHFEEIFALYEFDKNIRAIFLKFTLEIEVIIKSLISNLLAEEYGINSYLDINNFDSKANQIFINDLILNIQKEIKENSNKHMSVKHYQKQYGFVPPFVLTKILSFGTISRYYGLLKQSDRQKISKYFKFSDRLLKQILINLTMVRNKSAHSDRLFCFRSKYYINFKDIDSNYKRNGNITNLFMIIECMKQMLDTNKRDEFDKLLNREIENLKLKLKSISINDILKIMGYDV